MQSQAQKRLFPPFFVLIWTFFIPTVSIMLIERFQENRRFNRFDGQEREAVVVKVDNRTTK